jgi:hypothetical protein
VTGVDEDDPTGRTFKLTRGPAAGEAHALADQVAEDLGRSAVIDAMAGGDPFLAGTARTVLLAPAPHPTSVAYRQAVLTDCLREPELGRELYELAGRALEAQRTAARAVFFDTPETLLNQSMAALTSYLHLLRELRTLAERYRPRVASAGLTQFFAMVEGQLDEAYLTSAAHWLGRLRLGGDLLVSARLGADSQSEALVMRQAPAPGRGLFRRGSRTGLPRTAYKVPYGDEAGHRALSSLQDQALAGLAEDTSLTSGKFDEELRRMSEIADAIGPHGMLLCNESFQSTSGREGSDIARHLIDVMTEAGVTVVIVTHLRELAHGCYQDRERFPALFLRAGRDRTFRLHEAAPQATSHGTDLWNRRQPAPQARRIR